MKKPETIVLSSVILLGIILISVGISLINLPLAITIGGILLIHFALFVGFVDFGEERKEGSK
ncbi:hypothetical protein [Staphylococcus xylosus]